MDLQSIFHDATIVPQVLKAADNETLTGAGVDTAGYEGVAFIAYALKGEALNFSMKAQQDTASNFGTAADLVGTATAFSTTVPADAHAVLDIHKPRERYVRPIITVPNAVAATPVACLAILYGAHTVPVGNTGEFHLSPAEGTA